MHLELVVEKLATVSRSLRSTCIAIPLTLSILFIVVNGLRLALGYNDFIFAAQIGLLLVSLYGLRLLYISIRACYRLKKSICCSLLALSLILSLFLPMLIHIIVYCILTRCGIDSVILSFIATIILWNASISIISWDRSNVPALGKSIVLSIAFALMIFSILIGVSYIMFTEDIKDLHSLEEISSFVVSRTYTRVPPIILNAFRSDHNLYLWALLGIGRCGEMAFIAKTILEVKGFEAYIAGFPGEDHFFAIVYINGSWIALDPGYSRCRALPLEERVRYRLRELGNISSIIVYLDDGNFIDLTPWYIPHDTFVIRVTYRGKPIASACIELVHEFHGVSIEIPGKNRCFYTNTTGYATIHLGGSVYNGTAAYPYNPRYEIYVNGKPSHIYIESTATGKLHVIEIDLYSLGHTRR